MSWTGEKTDRNYGSKAVRILDMIQERDGMTFTEIQQELWNMAHSNGVGLSGGRPRGYDRKRDRGWWCTQLYGSPCGRPGLLDFYCRKDPATRKWRRKDYVPHLGKPFATMKRSQEEYDAKLTDDIVARGHR